VLPCVLYGVNSIELSTIILHFVFTNRNTIFLTFCSFILNLIKYFTFKNYDCKWHVLKNRAFVAVKNPGAADTHPAHARTKASRYARHGSPAPRAG
jgi:hypothetical protein